MFAIIKLGDNMKVEKLKNGKYKLSNESIQIETYDEVIVKNNILYKQLNDELAQFIQKENQYYDDYFKALKLISKRLRSESEIRKSLNDSEYKEIVIDKLKEENLINDARFTEAFILDKINFTKTGKNKIIKELLDHEIEEDIIYDSLSNIDNDIFLIQLEKLVRKRIQTNSKKSKTALKEKILYELISLGYEKEDILNYFDQYYEESPQIFEQEYNKIKAKLSKKYEGRELEYKIKEKLYQKGFKNNY